MAGYGNEKIGQRMESTEGGNSQQKTNDHGGRLMERIQRKENAWQVSN